jgi:hypothetical protein
MDDKSTESSLDFIMIHGYVFTEHGSMDPILRNRLDFGLHYYNIGLSKNMIVAGKCGNRDREILGDTPQSEYMRKYLEQKGVDPKCIAEENQGENTFDCTKNAYEKIILPAGYKSGIIVSTDLHLLRVSMQTKKIFPRELMTRVIFDGPSIEDPVERQKFQEHEMKALQYTLARTD